MRSDGLLVWFYGISTFVGHLMLNPVCYIYHHVVPLPQISLTLSLNINLYFPSHLASPLDYIQSPYRAIVDRF